MWLKKECNQIYKLNYTYGKGRCVFHSDLFYRLKRTDFYCISDALVVFLQLIKQHNKQDVYKRQVKYYNGGRLIKSAENDSTGNTSTTYSYDDKGQLISTLSLTVKNGQPSNEIQTNRLYDPQGHCIFEVQTNPKTKTDLYRRTRRIGTDGSIESDSLKYTRCV